MKILALELSSNQHSAAVVQSTAAGARILGQAKEAGTRGSRALGLIEAALQQSGAEREELQCVAVGLGPGSYTGIRAAIAVAQGWELATNVRLLGISSAECIAAQARAAGLRGPLSLAIDAQRNEVYLGHYNLSDTGSAETEALKIVPQTRLVELSAGGETFVGPEITRWLPGATVVFPEAGTLGLLAAARQDWVRGEQLQPIYLRETLFVKAPPARPVPPI